MSTTLMQRNLVHPRGEKSQHFDRAKQKKGPTIVDVRTPREFEKVHIPGSKNIPLTDLESSLSKIREIAKDHELTLVCRTQNRVRLAYDRLVSCGIPNCRILDGGITQWIADGKPVIRGKKGFSLDQQVRLSAGLLIFIGVVLGVLISPWFLLIPGGIGAGLIHAGWTDSCLMGTMLATLPFNRRRSPST